jgi:hypothetical protein
VCAAVTALLCAPRMLLAESTAAAAAAAAAEEDALQQLAIQVVHHVLSVVDCASAACDTAAATTCPLLLHLAVAAGVEALQQRRARQPAVDGLPHCRFNIDAVLTACVMQARVRALRDAALRALAALLAMQLMALEKERDD